MELYRIVGCIVMAAITLAEQRPARRELLVAAAASLSGLAPQLTRAFHDAAGIDVQFNFAGSNTLARQIVEGARVEVFISADAAQMDAVEHAGRLVAGTRVDVIGNQLVLIAPRGRGALDLQALPSAAVRRLAMGDPEAVPAGVYGRRWLENIRLWPDVSGKVVPLPSSPAVLAAVAAGRADAGIVYTSDVTGRGDVQIAHLVPVDDAPSIRYPAAAIAGGRLPLARQFLAFLLSATAQDIFVAAGFRRLGAA